jgi:hypothetical protein
MDITAAFEAAFGGSNPSARTTKNRCRRQGFFVCRRDSNGRERRLAGEPPVRSAQAPSRSEDESLRPHQQKSPFNTGTFAMRILHLKNGAASADPFLQQSEAPALTKP